MYPIAYLLTVISSIITGWYIYILNTGQESTLLKLAQLLLPFNDKFVHALAFGILAFCINFAFHFKALPLEKYKIYLGSIAILGFAMMEELTHAIVPSRELDFFNLLAASIGIVIFSFLTTAFKRFLDERYMHESRYNHHHFH